MFFIDTVILVTGVVLLLGIASSKFSSRFGVPVLVLFLTLGMLAGSQGIGGIDFANYELAHAIGTLALALILFDGGLRTPLQSIRSAWKPSFLLATLGVLITAVVTGVAATRILDVPLLGGMLLGSIVGSTDAAAVFLVLRSGGVSLPERLSSTLEIESGSNDPMAIFLTIGCIQVITGKMELGPELLGFFVKQMSLGAVAGLAVGAAAVWIINRSKLSSAGLYPVLATAFGLLAFGLAAWPGGSGFLAVYLAGIVMGNCRLVFQRGIFLFHDAAAWFGQIIMFVVLGLLSFPSRLLVVWWQALLIVVVLIVVARPVAILLSLTPFRFNWRQLLLLNWGGLKGAVPITLATFPLLYNVPRAQLLFDVVFFVVVVSALVQGWSLPYVARRLGLEQPFKPEPAVTLEISSLHHVDGDIVDYAVATDSRAAGRRVKELALPEGVVIAIIARDEQLIPPQGNTRIEAGDHVIVVMRPDTRPLVDQVFARLVGPRDELPEFLEFPLRGSVTVAKLEEFYGIKMNAPPSSSLDEAIRQRIGNGTASLDTTVRFGAITLHVRDLDSDGIITQVGMIISPEKEIQAAEAQLETSSDQAESFGDTETEEIPQSADDPPDAPAAESPPDETHDEP